MWDRFDDLIVNSLRGTKQDHNWCDSMYCEKSVVVWKIISLSPWLVHTIIHQNEIIEHYQNICHWIWRFSRDIFSSSFSKYHRISCCFSLSRVCHYVLHNAVHRAHAGHTKDLVWQYFECEQPSAFNMTILQMFKKKEALNILTHFLFSFSNRINHKLKISVWIVALRK